MKNYLFLTRDGFTYDNENNITDNLQLLGTGIGNDIVEAFNSFKYHQSYLKKFALNDIVAVEYVGDFINGLEL